MVAPAIAAGGIAAGSSLLGGLMSSRSASKDRAAAAALNAENIALQREFAQNGIRWKAEDAQRAGIHPLYALGATTHSFSPVTAFASHNDGMAEGFANAGQNIGRAVQAGLTQPNRTAAKLETLALERADLENELLRSQIAREKSQLGPPIPPAHGPGMFGSVGGTGPLVPVEEVPLQRTQAHAEKPWQEPGALSESGFLRTPTGLAPVPGKDAKERIEDQIIPEWQWSIRNNLIPSFGGDATKPPKDWLPKGAIDWNYSIWKQEWQPVFPPKNTPWKDGPTVFGVPLWQHRRQ